MYKLHATRRFEPVSHWVDEIGNFRLQLDVKLTPAIRNRVAGELDVLHRKAAKSVKRRFSLSEPCSEINPALRWTWEQIVGDADDPLDRDYPLER